jgi:hypothetical protein
MAPGRHRFKWMLKKVFRGFILAALAAVFACGGPSDSSAKRRSPGAATEAQKDLVSDGASGLAIRDELPFGEISGETLNPSGLLQIGEKVALVGKSASGRYWNRTIPLVRVRRSSGKEGWAPADYIIVDSVLAAVVEEQVTVFSRPSERSPAAGNLPFMTILAIHRDSAASDFVRFSSFDTSSGILYRGNYLQNHGLSSQLSNVESAILYRLALRTTAPAQRKAFLNTALKDYPDSAFAPLIAQTLSAMKTP